MGITRKKPFARIKRAVNIALLSKDFPFGNTSYKKLEIQKKQKQGCKLSILQTLTIENIFAYDFAKLDTVYVYT